MAPLRVALDSNWVHLRNFRHNVASGIDAAHRAIAEGHARFILLVSRLLIGEQEVELKALEGFHHSVGSPAQRLDVVSQCRGLDVRRVVGVDKVERRVIVRLGNV